MYPGTYSDEGNSIVCTKCARGTTSTERATRKDDCEVIQYVTVYAQTDIGVLISSFRIVYPKMFQYLDIQVVPCMLASENKTSPFLLQQPASLYLETDATTHNLACVSSRFAEL